MLYAILCYDREDVVEAWSREKDVEVMAKLSAVQAGLVGQGRMGPVARLMPTTAATTVRKGSDPIVVDGPYAETKEQLLGFYVVDCDDLEQAIETAKSLALASGSDGSLELRPLRLFAPGERVRLTDVAWIQAAITASRPQAVGALLRYFRDLDTAEEAFQDACLRALKSWPEKGPPRDPAAWLIMVGRNAGIDGVRRRAKQVSLPDEAEISDLDDTEEGLVDRLDGSDYRDDVLRLLFICCHPDLPATQQVALALRIVSGLSVKQIARAFLVGESAMEQRITRAKGRIAKADVPFETPGAVERSERLGAVAAMIYLIFNEGYSAGGPDGEARGALCGEAIRLARLLLRMFQTEPEIMGLTALMLLQHARTPARFDAAGEIILLDDQDRGLWNRSMIDEGLALIEKAMRHRRRGPYQVQAALAALHAQAATPQDTDWRQMDLLYAALEVLTPSPVVTLNRAVAVSKVHGAQAALEMIEPLAEPLGGYFHFFGLRGALLLQLGRTDEARISFDQAIARANTAAEAAHIRIHLDRLIRDSTPTAKAGGASR